MSATITKYANELEPGDVLLGAGSSHMTVAGVSQIGALGFTRVETEEFGTLYVEGYQVWSVTRPVQPLPLGAIAKVGDQLIVKSKDEDGFTSWRSVSDPTETWPHWLRDNDSIPRDNPLVEIIFNPDSKED